jgi:hypothetical protein
LKDANNILSASQPKEREDNVKKKVFKKLTLNKESIVCLDPSGALGEIVGGVSSKCTNTAECTISCMISCAPSCGGGATCRC